MPFAVGTPTGSDDEIGRLIEVGRDIWIAEGPAVPFLTIP